MEVRFSPDNYTKAGLSISRVIEILLDEAGPLCTKMPGIQVHFLIMATRHKERDAMINHVEAAVAHGQPGSGNGPRITGFDLAGQEEDNDPARFKDIFMPLHQQFMNITIHAGEMAADDKIWQALYDLHAKRVGHGLKLINNAKMMNYVRDYGIAIEMCPSSNIQTNDFRRHGREHIGDEYPLKEYMNKGIVVTINTDNRGISDTTLAKEYLEAARLSAGGLSRWEILRLIKNGFKAAFLPKDEKDALIKQIDDEFFTLILDDFYPEHTVPS
jgi:adenosine deaminase